MKDDKKDRFWYETILLLFSELFNKRQGFTLWKLFSIHYNNSRILLTRLLSMVCLPMVTFTCLITMS